MKKIREFASILKAEMIKTNVAYMVLAIVLCSILLSAVIYKICAYSVSYSEMNLYTYYCVELFTVYLLIFLPVVVWFLNIYEANIEKKNRGWLLVCISLHDKMYSIIAKHIVNIFIIMMFYLLLISEASIVVMRAWGMKFIFEALVVPLSISFLVTVPQILLVQYVCYVVENDVAIIMMGILYTIVTFSLAHTKYSDYLFTTYPYSVSSMFENVLFKAGHSIVIEIALILLGAIPLKFIKKHI